ncbi:unnamed protein product [Aureobasidium uvarum]|uniref:DUF7580 domain-containing protein n=1 Tax=Aureobasidium uvarum TaxID=2773716 RepID=A0A9N8KQQ5_9PEZI|nr:unnamed protein product [Aureobasidium uvarum]
MPENYRYLRTRLQYEHLRFEDWCEAAGFDDAGYQKAKDLPASFDPSGFTNAGETEVSDLQVLEKLRNISSRDNEDAKHSGNNSGEEFEKFLGRFKELNENLYQLLNGEQSRHLLDLTRKTQLDMVLVLKSVEELKHLQLAAVLQPDRAPDPSSYSRSDQILASLANFKQLNTASVLSPEAQQGKADNVRRDTLLVRSRITLSDEDDGSDSLVTFDGRTAGILDEKRPGHRNIWVEWRDYIPHHNNEGNELVAPETSVKRVQDLVTLLKLNKLDEFCAPVCHGYFDDNDNPVHDNRTFRFGLVFESTSTLQSPKVPETLRSMFGRSPSSLNARVRLAQRLCTCVLYLHAVNWLHKGINSRNIVFADPQDPSEPCVSGFELARPDTDQDKTQPGRHYVADLTDDIYCHPLYQGVEKKTHYQKTFDVYSLGLVLLEVALWRPIESIMGLEGGLLDRKSAASLRNRLMREDSEHMGELRARMGDGYQRAVSVCIVGRTALDIEEDADETDVLVAARLQRALMERVVDVIGVIRI